MERPTIDDENIYTNEFNFLYIKRCVFQTNVLRKDISRVIFNKFTLNQWNVSINVAPLIPTFIDRLYKSVEVHISIAKNSYSQRTAKKAICKPRH